MRVLEVINSLGTVGGSENFAVNFCKYLSRQSDIYVCILYSKNDESLLGRLFQSIGHDRVFILNKTGSFDLKIAKQIRTIIKTYDIQVVHTENDALISTYLAVFPLSKRPKIVHTLHNPPDKECQSRIKRLIYKRLFKKGLVHPVAITNDMAKATEKFYKLQNVPSIQNGVDLEVYTAGQALNKRGKDCTILARLTDQKNYPFVLNVFRKVHDLIPLANFFIYGDGELKEWLLSEIEGRDYIHYEGITNQSFAVLQDSKIFFLGSKYEGNPMSIWEAMATGCICVVPNINGLGEIIGRDAGFVLEAGNVDLFAAKIAEILQRPEYFINMQGKAIAKASQNSFENVCNLYMQQFEKA